MNHLLPDTLDRLLEDIGYVLTGSSVSVSVDMVATSDIHAVGRDEPVLDRDEIIKHLCDNGISITSLHINCTKNFTSHHVIGSRQPLGPVILGEEISLEFTCYTDTVPEDAKRLKPYERPEIPEVEPETISFDLGGAL